jgi:formylmethanofuran--tetrahydromethanopterin N-formyltransferase
MSAVIDDTYAEAFRSIYVEFLITACNRRWVDHAVKPSPATARVPSSVTAKQGHRYVGPSTDESFTPDSRPGGHPAHVPRFKKDRVRALEMASLVRISQNVLTCPTAALQSIDADTHFKLGRKVAFFGDGFQNGRAVRPQDVVDRPWRRIPAGPPAGVCERADGGTSVYLESPRKLPGRSGRRGSSRQMPRRDHALPGGIAAAAPRRGLYSFAIASTYEKFCPLLRNDPRPNPSSPGVTRDESVNSRDLDSISHTQAAISASASTPDSSGSQRELRSWGRVLSFEAGKDGVGKITLNFLR